MRGGGGAQAGAPAGALEATHATPWPLRIALPAPVGAPPGPRSSGILEERRHLPFQVLNIRREEGWGGGPESPCGPIRFSQW